jgi:ribonuclease T2
VPSNTTTYQLGDIQNALQAQIGGIFLPLLWKNGTVLQEVWYFNQVYGPVSCSMRRCQLSGVNSVKVQSGHFKPLDSVTTRWCPSVDGIYFYERTPTSECDARVLR